MMLSEYEQLQNRLRKKLKYCNGLTGKHKEGFKEGIRVAMSILHSIKHEELIMQNYNSLEFRKVKGHIEVYCDGEFMFSADNTSEAEKELREIKQDI